MTGIQFMYLSILLSCILGIVVYVTITITSRKNK